jgi:hypothetical protein
MMQIVFGTWSDFGMIPDFIVDPSAPVIPQFDAAYGWRDAGGFEPDHMDIPGEAVLKYYGDPDMHELARMVLPSGECVIMFPYAWVCVWKQGEPYETIRIARMD